MALTTRSAGYKKQPTVEPAGGAPTPSRHSGGTSGNLSIPGYKPKTPTVPYNPAAPSTAPQDFAEAFHAKEAHEHHAEVVEQRRVQQAEAKQRRLVEHFVTKAYESPKSQKGSSGAKNPFGSSLTTNVERANKNVAKEREKLLNHPAVKSANAEGKVVSIKGLSRIEHGKAQAASLEPHFASAKDFIAKEKTQEKTQHSIESILTPKEHGPKPAAPVQKATTPTNNKSGYTPPSAMQLEVQKAFEEPAQKAGVLPKHQTIGQQIYTDIAEWAPLVLPVADEAGLATKAKSIGEAIKSLPGMASDLKEGIRELPAALRTGAKELPNAAKAGIKNAPRATARFAAEGGASSAKAVGGLEVATLAHRAGVSGPSNVFGRADAFLTGTGKALEENPGGTLKTTLRSLPAYVTGPAALALAGIQSGYELSPKPLENTASEFAKGTGHVFGKLGSGESKAVQEAIEKEVGLTPYIPVPAAISKLHGSDLYKETRGAIRKGVDKTRSKAVPDRSGTHYVPEKKAKPPVPDSSRPGENYVSHWLGEKIESGKARRNVALDVTRAATQGEVHGGIEAHKIVGASRNKAGRNSRLAKKMGAPYEASPFVMAQYGIPHGVAGEKLTKELSEFYGSPEQPPVPGELNSRMAVNAAVENPQIFNDAQHEAIKKAYRSSAERLSDISSHSSKRAARIPQTDFLNYKLGNMTAAERKAADLPPVILKPEQQISSDAAQYTSTGEQATALRNQADALDKKASRAKSEESANATRSEAEALRAHAAHLEEGHLVSREGAFAHYREMKDLGERLWKEGKKDAAKAVQKRAKALYREIKGYTHPEHNLDRSVRPIASKEMTGRYVKENDRVAAHFGMEPGVYMKDVRATEGPLTASTVERPFSSRATHVKTGEIARKGESNVRFESAIDHSVVAPRTRIAYNELIHHSLDSGKMPVKVGGTYKHVLTDKEIRQSVAEGTFPANGRAVPLGVIKQALTGEHALTHDAVSKLLSDLAKGGESAAAKALENLPADLRDEILRAEAKKGTKYAIVNHATIDELVKQFKSPDHPNWRKAANVPTRIILNDPGWVLSQLFAKGIPIATALGPEGILRAPWAIKAMAQIQKMDPADQARIASMIGSSAGVTGTPHYAFEAARDPFSNVRAIRHSTPGRKLWNLANGNYMGKWDRWNAAKMREYAAAVRSSKGFKNWFGGFKGLNKDMAMVAKATEGMSAADRLAYVAKHPDLARAVQKDLNRIGGNWNSFTALERQVAPFTLFYPWIRYSIDWTFHVFPINHPVAATALGVLGQMNSNQLQKIASENAGGVKGITPTSYLGNPLEYAYPVTHNKNNEPQAWQFGSRIAPSLGLLGSTITSGKLSNLASGASPEIGIPASLITNTNFFTGEKLKGSPLSEGLNQLVTLSPFGRAVEAAGGYRGFGKGNQSALSKAYEILEGQKVVRSVGMPLIPTSARAFGLKNALNKVEETIAKTGSSARDEVKYDLALSPAERGKKMAEMKKQEYAALHQREKLLKEIGGPELAKQANEEYELGKKAESLEGGSGIYGGGNSIYGGGSSIYGGGSSIYGGNSIYGGGEEKNYKAPGKPNTFNLPSVHIPGLGGITGAITNFIGGTPAQAATLPKGAKNSTKANHVVAQSLPGWGLNPKKVGVLRKVEKETGVPAAFLASISKTESTNGTSTLPGVRSGANSAGAAGPFQIGNGTGAAGNAWQEYATKIWGKNASQHSIYNYADAARVAGEYLKDAGVTHDPATWTQGALAYNHSTSYASEVASNAQAAAHLPWGKAGNVKPFYANPLPANAWSPGRSDQGYDAAPTTANAPVLAVSKAKIIATGAPGWPEGGGVTYRILEGPQKGKEVYAFEGLNSVVKPGQVVKRGQVIARGRQGGSIEMGYYSGNQDTAGHPLNNTVIGTGQTYSVGGTDGQQTVGSRQFERQILGKAVEVPAVTGPGGEVLTPAAIVTGSTVAAYSQATGKSARQVAKELKIHALTPIQILQHLNQVERIAGGSGFGVPGLTTGAGQTSTSSVGPSPTDIAAIGAKLASERKRLKVA